MLLNKHKAGKPVRQIPMHCGVTKQPAMQRKQMYASMQCFGWQAPPFLQQHMITAHTSVQACFAEHINGPTIQIGVHTMPRRHCRPPAHPTPPSVSKVCPTCKPRWRGPHLCYVSAALMHLCITICISANKFQELNVCHLTKVTACCMQCVFCAVASHQRLHAECRPPAFDGHDVLH
jgi:hypothetical protein